MGVATRVVVDFTAEDSINNSNNNNLEGGHMAVVQITDNNSSTSNGRSHSKMLQCSLIPANNNNSKRSRSSLDSFPNRE